MDVSQSMLVAIMFVMLLSLGISNVLIGLAASLEHRSELQTHWIPTSWHVLLLLEIFDLFWHTLEILERESWTFLGFLYVMTGPILLFLATSLLLPHAGDRSLGDSQTQYLRAARPFFAVLAVYLPWLIGLDFVLADGGFSAMHIVIAAGTLLAIVMSVSRQIRVHGTVTVLFWILFLSVLATTAARAMR